MSITDLYFDAMLKEMKRVYDSKKRKETFFEFIGLSEKEYNKYKGYNFIWDLPEEPQIRFKKKYGNVFTISSFMNCDKPIKKDKPTDRHKYETIYDVMDARAIDLSIALFEP